MPNNGSQSALRAFLLASLTRKEGEIMEGQKQNPPPIGQKEHRQNSLAERDKHIIEYTIETRTRKIRRIKIPDCLVGLFEKLRRPKE